MGKRTNKSTIVLRINQTLKDDITAIASSSSLTMTDVITSFLMKCVKQNCIPLSLLGGSKEYSIDSSPIEEVPSELFKNYYLIHTSLPKDKSEIVIIYIDINLKEKVKNLFSKLSISLTITDAITLFFMECVKQNRIITINV